MAKGSYSVGNQQQQQSNKDTSFRSFICSLLIFLALCIIILLATIRWNNKTPEEFQQKAEKNVKEDVEVFDVNDKNNSNRIVVIAVPENVPNTTTNPTIETTIRQEIHATSLTPEKEFIDFEGTKGTTTTSKTRIFGPTTATTRIFGPTSTTTKIFEPTTSITKIFRPNTEKATTEGNFETSTKIPTNRQESTTVKASTTAKVNTVEIIETTISGASTETETTTGTEITTQADDTTSPSSAEEESTTTTSIFSPTKSSLILAFSTTEKENSTFVQNSTEESVLTTSEENSISISTSTFPSTNFEPESTLATSSTTNGKNSTFSSTKPPLTAPPTVSTLSTLLEDNFSTTWMTSVENSTVSSTTFSLTSPPTLTTEEDSLTSTSTSSATESSTVLLSTAKSTTTPSTFTTKSTTSPQNLVVVKSKICTTSTCNQTVSRMLNLMKHSVSPCEDFYEFACGGGGEYGLSNNLEKSINDALLSYLINIDNNSSEKYDQNFNNFYKSCAKYEDFFKYNERIKNVTKLIGDVGQFENITNIQQPYNITDLFAKLLLRQSLPFFHFALDIDQNSTFILQLTIPERGSLQSGLKDWSNLYWHHQNCLHKQKSKIFDTYLDLNQIYESLESCRSNYSNYLDSIEETIQQLGIFDHLDPAQFRKEIKDLRFTIEFDILNLIDHFPTPSDIEQAYVDKNYDYKTIVDLQADFSIIDWKELLQTLTGYDFQPNDQIQIYFWQQFTKIFDSLSRVNQRKLNNALLAIYADNLYQNTIIPKTKTNRDLYCLDLTKQLLPDVAFFTIQTLFVEKIETGQRLIGNLFDLLKRQFEKNLFERDWLDENSTTILMEQFTKIHADFPINIDDQILNDNHQGLTIGDNYQENLIKLIINRKKIIGSLVTKPSTPQLLYFNFLEPLSVEPLTIQQNGSIVIPFGLLYKFQPNIPSYLTVSSIGWHLSRAIVRNFDKHFMEKSISQDAMAYYNYLLHNTEDQTIYFSPRIYEQRNITFKLNGSLSVNERMIDNAAFRLILDTLTNSSSNDKLLPWISDSFSREKIIFITAAQEYCEHPTILDFILQIFENHHLPTPLKIQNIIGNSESFIEKFKCAEGAGMNLIEDKLQFPYLVNQEDMFQSLSDN